MRYKYVINLYLMLVFVACENGVCPSKNELTETICSSSLNTFDHIEHIRNNSRKRQLDGISQEPEYFVDYVIEELLEKSEHKKYITDRKLLRKLNNVVCWDNYVLIRDTLTNGDKCEIEINTQKFTPEEHKLTYESEYALIEIDGKWPYGGAYGVHPDTELKSLSIKINDMEIDSKISEYDNIYDPMFCNFGGFQKIVEAYEYGDNIFIYIFGGNVADTYFAKLVFDRSGYVTSIIVDYIPLSIFGSFGEHFIGY